MRDAHTMILHNNVDFLYYASLFPGFCRNPYMTIFARIFHRIHDQILKTLREGREIANNPWQAHLDVPVHRETSFIQQALSIAKSSVNDLGNFKRSRVVIFDATSRSREQQYLIDQIHQLARLLRDYRPLLA